MEITKISCFSLNCIKKLFSHVLKILIMTDKGKQEIIG